MSADQFSGLLASDHNSTFHPYRLKTRLKRGDCGKAHVSAYDMAPGKTGARASIGKRRIYSGHPPSLQLSTSSAQRGDRHLCVQLIFDEGLFRRGDGPTFLTFPQILVCHPCLDVRLELIPQSHDVEGLLADDRRLRMHWISAIPAEAV